MDGIEYKLVPIREEKKTKAIFILTMPRINTWNGHWSGEGKKYVQNRTAFRRTKPIYPNLKEGKYGYDFGDGWYAQVEVKFVTPTECRNMMKKSDGFCGYDWMIDELCVLGRIKTFQERHGLSDAEKRTII